MVAPLPRRPIFDEIAIRADWLSPTGLQLPESLPYPTWCDVGKRLAEVSHACQWWIGDWFNHGAERFGEASARAIADQLGLEARTVWDCAWVSRRVPTSRRREVLSFSHHREVAPLDPTLADQVLDRAASQQWNREQLRSAVRALRRPPGLTIEASASAPVVRLIIGDCRQELPKLEAESVHCVVTSPPFYGLRDYGLPPLVWGGDLVHAHQWSHAIRNGITGGGQASSTLGPNRDGNVSHDNEFRRVPPSCMGFCACGAVLGSLGLEPTPEMYIEHLLECFRHVRRVLRPDGCCFLNLGDSYAGSGKGPSNSLQPEASCIGAPEKGLLANRRISGRRGGGRNPNQYANGQAPTSWIPVGAGYKPKDLLLMPFRVAMALQADGWYVRSTIPWLKRNSMPESTTDRPTTSVEYVFLLAKSECYFWDADAVRVPQAEPWRSNGKPEKNNWSVNGERGSHDTVREYNPNGRNRRNGDWFFESWQGLLLDEQDEPLALMVNPQPFPGSHFATFPPTLVEPMIKAGTSEKGCCPVCHAPWVREMTNLDTRHWTERRLTAPSSRVWADGSGGHHAGTQFEPALRAECDWRPSCAHPEATQPVPCVVLDPFSGAGTTCLVATRLGRASVGIDAKPEYVAQARERLRDVEHQAWQEEVSA